MISLVVAPVPENCQGASGVAQVVEAQPLHPDGTGGEEPGLPRAINNLAIQALVAAYAAKKAIVDESSARAVVTEITAE
jgi:type II secretory pathway predicted ATPase ExeA